MTKICKLCGRPGGISLEKLLDSSASERLHKVHSPFKGQKGYKEESDDTLINLLGNSSTELVGPYYWRQTGYYTHFCCAVWAPNVVSNHQGIPEAKGVVSEILRARSLKCFKCKHNGAAVGCWIDSCRRSYHLPCGIEDGCWHRDYRLYCPQHTKAAQEYWIERQQGGGDDDEGDGDEEEDEEEEGPSTKKQSKGTQKSKSKQKRKGTGSRATQKKGKKGKTTSKNNKAQTTLTMGSGMYVCKKPVIIPDLPPPPQWNLSNDSKHYWKRFRHLWNSLTDNYFASNYQTETVVDGVCFRESDKACYQSYLDYKLNVEKVADT